MEVLIRWMIRRDMPEALNIENATSDHPWVEDDFIHCLRQRNCIGMVAEQVDRKKSRIVGFMIYELNSKRLDIQKLAVAPHAQRKGVGTQMINKLVDKLSKQRRNQITLVVPETNLASQLFFKATGFQAISILRNQFHETDEDAYFMRYLYSSTAMAQ